LLATIRGFLGNDHPSDLRSFAGKIISSSWSPQFTLLASVVTEVRWALVLQALKQRNGSLLESRETISAELFSPGDGLVLRLRLAGAFFLISALVSGCSGTSLSVPQIDRPTALVQAVWAVLAWMLLASPQPCNAQALSLAPSGAILLGQSLSGTNRFRRYPWDITIEDRVGFPVGGTLQSVDRPVRGTRFTLRELGINVSEAAGGTVAYSITPRDAVRAGFLYYFLNGSSTHDSPVDYNSTGFPPGSLYTDASYWRIGLAYERTLLSLPSDERLVGSAGITYVAFCATLIGSGQNNTEIFSGIPTRRILPIPVVGLRWDHPLAQGLMLRTSFVGGGLPHVNSLRSEEEGNTLYQEQVNVGLDAGLACLLGHGIQVEGGSLHLFSLARDE
jgi:hypothetical protein